MSLVWKRRFGKVWGLISTPSNRAVILIYHSVAGGPASTRRLQFETQMAWLDRHAAVVDLANIVDCSQKIDGKVNVALTFDDGYRSVHDIAAPILQRYKFPATVYINSGHIGDSIRENSDVELGHYPEESFMTWDEVTNLKSLGWNIGSHGVNHLDLTLQSDSVVTSQLTDSRSQISARMGTPCIDFCYTWGHHNRSLRDAIARVGYKSGVGGTHSSIKPPANLFALPRLDIRKEYEIEDFIAVMRGDWDYLRFYHGLRGAMQ